MYHNQVWASQILNAKGSWDVVNVDYGSTHGAPSLIQLSPTIASRDMGIPEAYGRLLIDHDYNGLKTISKDSNMPETASMRRRNSPL